MPVVVSSHDDVVVWGINNITGVVGGRMPCFISEDLKARIDIVSRHLSLGAVVGGRSGTLDIQPVSGHCRAHVAAVGCARL